MPRKDKAIDLFNRLDSKPYIDIMTDEGDSVYKQCYKIMIHQPIDHNDTMKGGFEQKVHLSHV